MYEDSVAYTKNKDAYILKPRPTGKSKDKADPKLLS
jgi:hypothetical protein